MAETGDDSWWGQTKLFGLYAKDLVTGGDEAAVAWTKANTDGSDPAYEAQLHTEVAHAETVTKEELKQEVSDAADKVLALPRKALESALGIPFPILIIGAACLLLGAVFIYRKAGK